MGRGNIGVGDEEVQTIRYKISYKDIMYNMRTQPIFYKHKWSIIIKNGKLLYYLYHIILYIKYTSVSKNKSHKNKERTMDLSGSEGRTALLSETGNSGLKAYINTSYYFFITPSPNSV